MRSYEDTGVQQFEWYSLDEICSDSTGTIGLQVLFFVDEALAQ